MHKRKISILFAIERSEGVRWRERDRNKLRMDRIPAAMELGELDNSANLFWNQILDWLFNEEPQK